MKSYFNFWQDVLLSTLVLYQHTKVQFPTFVYTNEIVRFLQEEMKWNLRVKSWEYSLVYVMNDLAEPSQDMPKLFAFIESQSWKDIDIIGEYLCHLKSLLSKHEL